MLRWLAIAVLILTGSVRPVAAAVDPPDPYEVFYKGTLREALDESKERHRVLIIYVRGDNAMSEKMDRVTWTNPVVAGWVKWHAIAYRVNFNDDPGLCGRLGVKPENLPMSLFYIDGVEFATLPRRNTGLPVIGMEDPFQGPLSGYQSPAYFVFFMDFTLQRALALKPIFGAFHEEKNPPPPPPPPSDPFHTVDDGLGATVPDPVGPDGIDVLEMLAEARRAVEMDDLYRATGLYTWLWERAEAVDPAFGPIRHSVLAEEMRQLARRHEPARKRFSAMRDDVNKRMLWADFDEIFEWFVMNEIVGDDGESLKKLDFELNDPYMETMMPQADVLAYKIMMARERFADPNEIGDDPVARVRRLAELARSRPRQVHMDDWPLFQSFAREHLLHEACRLHVALLGRGRHDEAMRTAEVLLGARNDAGARLALVATALATNRVLPRHAAWLKEAEELGTASPILARRIDEALLAKTP